MRFGQSSRHFAPALQSGLLMSTVIWSCRRILGVVLPNVPCRFLSNPRQTRETGESTSCRVIAKSSTRLARALAPPRRGRVCLFFKRSFAVSFSAFILAGSVGVAPALCVLVCFLYIVLCCRRLVNLGRRGRFFMRVSCIAAEVDCNAKAVRK